MSSNEDKKNETMTCLSGAFFVPKTHGRIIFRGLIDTLEAEVVEAQVLALELGEKGICGSLEEILDYLRALMAAEVKETPLAPPYLFGMDAEEIHRRSHGAFVSGEDGKAVLPSYAQGPMAARLNTLRAKVREVELTAVRVFGSHSDYGPHGDPWPHGEREDITLALNRLSSALWWLFCECVNKRYLAPGNAK